MEENKNKKLSYEELSKAASDLHVQYQKLMAEYQKLVAEYQKATQALQNREFDYTAFFLQMLFKVVEHPEMYSEDFMKWCVDNIQGALTGFAESTKQAKEEASKDEAE